MPIYDFICPICKNEAKDVLTKYTDKAWCTKCNVEMEKKFPIGTSFELKGRGWAKDNYSKDSK